MTNSISERIDTLKQQAANAGDDVTVRICETVSGYALFDSDTAVEITPDELCPDEDYPMHKYIDALFRSVNCQQTEGHVSVGGRRVYAQ